MGRRSLSQRKHPVKVNPQCALLQIMRDLSKLSGIRVHRQPLRRETALPRRLQRVGAGERHNTPRRCENTVGGGQHIQRVQERLRAG